MDERKGFGLIGINVKGDDMIVQKANPGVGPETVAMDTGAFGPWDDRQWV